MKEYLAFVDFAGNTIEGNYIYRFDFTKNPDVVWGDYFNIAPAIIVPSLEPDKNCLSRSAKAIFPREMIIAKTNSCFSMQDCIDGIIDLMFSEIDDETLEIDEMPFSLKFGEDMDVVVEKLSKIGITLFDFADVKNIKNVAEDAIDDLLNSGILDNNESDNEEDF
jgi:hypothetical protein